jgi:hypothetical protein
MKLKDIISGFMLLQYIILFIYILFHFNGTVEIDVAFSVGPGASINYPIRFNFNNFLLGTAVAVVIAIVVLLVAVSTLGIGGDKAPSVITKTVLMIVVLTFLGISNLWLLSHLSTLGTILTVVFGVVDTFYLFSYTFSDTSEEI